MTYGVPSYESVTQGRYSSDPTKLLSDEILDISPYFRHPSKYKTPIERVFLK